MKFTQPPIPNSTGKELVTAAGEFCHRLSPQKCSVTKCGDKEFPLFLLPFLEKKESLSPCHRKITSASSDEFHSQLERCGDNGDTGDKARKPQ
jgi:hypothetical protein